MYIEFITLDRQERTILKLIEVLSEEFYGVLIKIHKDSDQWNLFNKVMMQSREEVELTEIID